MYFPPRSAAEEEQLRYVLRPEQVQRFRNQVSVSAIKAAASYLGTLREGRKTLFVVTQGFGPAVPWAATPSEQQMDLATTASSVIQTANDSNTAIHIVDPRGLQVNTRLPGLPEAIAGGTGGEMHLTNDLTGPFHQAVKQAGAVYLLGYTREMPVDGKFHQSGSCEARRDGGAGARRLLGAPGGRRRAREADRRGGHLPPAVAAAFASLPPTNAPRLVDLWAGASVRPTGGQITLAWTARSRAPRNAIPAGVVVSVALGQQTIFEGHIESGGTTFEAPPGTLKIAVTVRTESGEVVDSFPLSVERPDPATSVLSLGTPILYRARTPGELRALTTPLATPPIHAGRDFVRTDRLIVRITAQGVSAGNATVVGKLLDRRGKHLLDMPAPRATPDGVHQIDLPLASIAGGEFVLVLEATSGNDRAEALVPFRVVR